MLVQRWPQVQMQTRTRGRKAQARLRIAFVAVIGSALATRSRPDLPLGSAATLHDGVRNGWNKDHTEEFECAQPVEGRRSGGPLAGHVHAVGQQRGSVAAG